MEFNEVVAARRSIRAYQKDRVIARETLEEILKTAQEAPTWKNTQTGRYYIVNTPEKVAEIKAKILPEFNQNSVKDASALIICTYVKNIAGFAKTGEADNELGNQWGAYDLGCQNTYLCLKASEMGLDTLIMGLRDADACHAELGIPEEEQVVTVIAMGYREADAKRPRRKELDVIAKFF